MNPIIRYTTLNFLLLDFVGNSHEYSKQKANDLLEKKTFFTEIKKDFPEIDLSMYSDEDLNVMNEELQDLSVACSDKLEVRNDSGFCQIIAYSTEMIQRHIGDF